MQSALHENITSVENRLRYLKRHNSASKLHRIQLLALQYLFSSKKCQVLQVEIRKISLNRERHG